MADYISKKEQNEIMFECKIKGRLSVKAIEMFELQAKKISNSYDYRCYEDKEDAIQQAIHDFTAYWKNYKINPIGSIQLVRNFYHGETFTVKLNGNIHVYTAKSKKEDENDFEIGSKTNITIENLANLINSKSGLEYWASIHKVTRKIAIIDDTCYGNSNGVIVVNKLVGNRLSKKDNNPHVGDSIFVFLDPPAAFNFLTSVARNGLFKASKVLYSDTQKITTPFSSINSENGGIFNH